MFRHATITIDGRCLDLLMTEEEISSCFERTLSEDNQRYIDAEKCCGCWPTAKPPECPFWRRIMGICEGCGDK
jgi:hypothetical protein